MYRIRGLLKEALPKRERGDEERRINADAVLEPSPVVQADLVQLQLVILNLIINAVEAMSSLCEGHANC